MHTSQAQRRWAMLTLVGAIALAGCASTDPSVDIDRAAVAFTERSALVPNWTTSWNAESAWTGATTLSCDEAVSVALTRNRALREALNDIAMARAELAAAETPPNPVVSFVYGAPTDGGPGSMITASVMTQLAWLWRRPTEVAAAEATLRASTLRAADAALATIAEVRSMHVKLVAAEAEAGFAAVADDAMRLRAELISSQRAAGLMTATDLRMAQEKSLAAHRERVNVNLELDRMKVALLDLLALSDTSLEWRSDGAWPTEPSISDPETLAIDAPSRRLDVAARAAEALAADHAARAAGLDRLPMVDLGAMYERPMDGGETLGPQIVATVPILDRGDASIAKAAARREAALLAFDRASHAARSEARTEALNWIAARNAWHEGSEPRRGLAERELDAVREARAAGTVDRVMECDAVAMLAERSMFAIRDRMKAAEAAIRFERATGGQPRAGATNAFAIARGAAR